jgi:type I restriction enzyme S subunit
MSPSLMEIDGFVFDPAISIKEGDIIISRACGSPKLVGSVARVGSLLYKLILSDKTFRLNLRHPEAADFVVAAMNANYFRAQVEQAISGAEGLANNLPLSSLKDLRIAMPPSDEAISIAEKLKPEIADLERRIAIASSEIDLLREYRGRLIADVVTGKVDVRGVELPQTEPTEVLEPLFDADEDAADREMESITTRGGEDAAD